jgi:hypothetical protein
MGSSFILTLDTTPPKLFITVPKYSVIGFMTEIIVEADEELSEEQDIYIIDSLGVRHDLIFLYDGKRFLGQVDFSGFSHGVATIYARLSDSVYNQSEIAIATIDIKQAASLFLTSEKLNREIQIGKSQRILEFTTKTLAQNTRVEKMGIYSEQLTRKIEVKFK